MSRLTATASVSGNFLKYSEDEILIVMVTSSSETFLPGMIAKLENLGCAKSVVGVVVPGGIRPQPGWDADLSADSRDLCGASHKYAVEHGEEWWIRLMLILTSKGSAAVTVVAKWEREFNGDRGALLLNGAPLTADELAER